MSVFDSIKEKAGDLAEKAKDVAGDLKDKAEDLVDKVKGEDGGPSDPAS